MTTEDQPICVTVTIGLLTAIGEGHDAKVIEWRDSLLVSGLDSDIRL